MAPLRSAFDACSWPGSAGTGARPPTPKCSASSLTLGRSASCLHSRLLLSPTSGRRPALWPRSVEAEDNELADPEDEAPYAECAKRPGRKPSEQCTVECSGFEPLPEPSRVTMHVPAEHDTRDQR